MSVAMRERNKKKYGKNLWGILSILAGTFLIIEHIWNFGEFEFLDFIGHEWLGFILILFGILINTNFKKETFSSELKKIFGGKNENKKS